MKFTYDKQNDTLYIYRLEDKKSKDNIGKDRIIIDLDADNQVIGVEIIDASHVLQEHSGREIEDIKGVLDNLTDCSFDHKNLDDTIHITIQLDSEGKRFLSDLDVHDSRTAPIL